MAERYSLGRQTFSLLIKEDLVYVDKTDMVFRMVEGGNGKAFFLARPRRFGKSLLVSTLKSVFEGQQALFKGLYIEDKIIWKPYPVIHLSMEAIGFETLGLEEALTHELKKIAQKEGTQLTETSAGLCFQELIRLLSEKYQQQVVILIDEYDKPITHGLEDGDSSISEKNRDIMKRFYSGLKSADADIRFLFITGISKFAKVSIFSDLNHLKDISLDKKFALICGYTQAEIAHYFPEGLARLATENGLDMAQTWAKIKDWYNGFSWDGVHFVYNPFSTLQLLSSGQFANYWFASGTPTFLVKMLNANFDYQLENVKMSNVTLNAFDLKNLDAKSVLMQTGYLTIKKVLDEDLFLLGFPNKEVHESFNQMLIEGYLHQHHGDSAINIFDIRNAFKSHDVPQVMAIIDSLFASVPATLFTKKVQRAGKTVTNPVGENFFHAVIYLIFNTLGVKMDSEVAVRNGRIDAVVETKEYVYIFEFKKDQSPDAALLQIKQRQYPDKYRTSGKQIMLIGVNFSIAKRGIDSWKIEKWEQ